MNIPEVTPEQFRRAISSTVRRRIMAGRIESGADVSAIRRFGSCRIRLGEEPFPQSGQ